MDNIAQNNNIKLIENRLKEIASKIKDNSIINIKNELLELQKENNHFKQRIITYTAALMHQRRKAAENVDDQYFEHEIFIEAHEELDCEIRKLLKVV